MKSRILLLARLALRSILQNWRHSLATMLAVLGGFAAVSLLDGFLAEIRAYQEDHFVYAGMTGHVIIEKKGAADHLFEDVWLYSLDKTEQEKLQGILAKEPGVEATMRYLVLSGLLSNGSNNAIFIGAGYDEEAGRKIRGRKWEWNTVAGKPLFEAPKGGGLILGMGLADRMACEYDHAHHLNPDGSIEAREKPLRCPGSGLQLSVTTEHSQVNAVTIPVVGVNDMQLREYNDKVLSMPLETAQRLLDTDRISRVMVLLKDKSLIPDFLSGFRKQAEIKGLDVEAVEWIDHPLAALAKGGMEVMDVFRALFLGVVAVIAAMSVANSMMKSINERVREIGTLRSFGFRRRDVVLLFSLEGFFLGILSCAGGIVVTSILAFLLTHAGITFKAGMLSTPIALQFSMPLSLWLKTAAGLGLITFLASWMVSRKAAFMGIADALRHTA